MSEGTVTAIIVVTLILSLTTCYISGRWAVVEQERIQLERDKLGVGK